MAQRLKGRNALTAYFCVQEIALCCNGDKMQAVYGILYRCFSESSQMLSANSSRAKETTRTLVLMSL